MHQHFTVILLSLFLGPNVFAEKPNLVFMIADDCTFRDIGCYGGQAYTPNLDKLADQGMRFTRCFQSAPMCSPTRHNIYTGIYPVKSGAYPNHTRVNPGVTSIVKHLGDLGYRVAQSGKTHVGPNDVFRWEKLGTRSNPEFDAVNEFLGQCKVEKDPFCLLLCSNEPHLPWNKGDASRYPVDKIELPTYFVDTPETRQGMSRYLAEITYYDGQVGEAIALLDQHGLTENTLLVVVSEQGSSMPFAKWTCYDNGLQSACIARWPGKIKPGSVNGSHHFGIRSVRSEKFKYIWNFTPDQEFSNACTTSEEFQSWIALAKTGDDRAKSLVNRYISRPLIELYDIEKDPFEMNNLADRTEYDAVKSELRAELDRWMLACGDKGQVTEMEALEHTGKGEESETANPSEKTRKKNKKKKAKQGV